MSPESGKLVAECRTLFSDLFTRLDLLLMRIEEAEAMQHRAAQQHVEVGQSSEHVNARVAALEARVFALEGRLAVPPTTGTQALLRRALTEDAENAVNEQRAFRIGESHEEPAGVPQ